MIRNFVSNYLSKAGFIKAETMPADVRRWLMPESEAEAWRMPDPSVYSRQADLYRKLSYIGTVVDMTADACIDSDFDVTDDAGVESETHPFVMLLDDPNPFDSRTEFLRAHFAWRKISGNSYWYLNRTNENVAPDEIWILPPSKIIPVPDGKMGLRGYLYTPGNGDQIPLEPYEVLHFKSFNPNSRYLGLSAIESLAFTATGALASQEWNTRLFAENNARLPGILAFAEMIQDSDWEKMKASVQDATKKRNQMMLRGVGKGGVEWMQASATQREMEFLEGLQMSKQDIYDRLAPGLFSAMQTSALTNGENGLYLFAKYTIAPLLRELTDKLNCDILPTYGEGWTAEYENVVPEDKTLEMAQIEQYAKFHTVNEVRVEMFGNSPDPDPERGALFASQIAAKSSAPEVVPPVVPEIVAGEPAPTPEPMDAEPEEDDTAVKLMKHDLSNWKRKAIKAVGTDAASVFVSDYIPADVLADIAGKIKASKTADDIAAAFKMAGTINKESTTDAPPPSDKAIKALAAQLERAIDTQPKEDMKQTIIIDTQGNTMKAHTDGNAQILEAIKALVQQNSIKADIVVPAPVVNVTVPEQAAPVVNVPITVQPAAPAVNNITVKPADVVIPPAPTEATITTDFNGNKKLVVK